MWSCETKGRGLPWTKGAEDGAFMEEEGYMDASREDVKAVTAQEMGTQDRIKGRKSILCDDP